MQGPSTRDSLRDPRRGREAVGGGARDAPGRARGGRLKETRLPARPDQQALRRRTPMNWRKWIVPVLMVVFMLIVLGADAAMAQHAAAAAPEASGKKTLWELFKSTGVVGIIIVLLSVAGV